MSTIDASLIDAADRLLSVHRERATRVAVAESCTGGLVSAALTALPGSSDVFVAGYVTYANEAKMRMLGVDPVLLELHGAVSAEVAEAMAQGALERSGANVAVSITGIAGPGGGSTEKPVGTVWFGIASPSGVSTKRERFDPSADRDTIRRQAALEALSLLRP